MRKRLALLAVSALALAGTSIGGASAEDVCTDIGCAGTYGDGVYADGAAGNPDPLDGYLTVTSSGICSDDNGSPGDSDTPMCNP